MTESELFVLLRRSGWSHAHATAAEKMLHGEAAPCTGMSPAQRKAILIWALAQPEAHMAVAKLAAQPLFVGVADPKTLHRMGMLTGGLTRKRLLGRARYLKAQFRRS